MATATQQINAAARRMAPKIYEAITLHPDASGRAQLLRMVLVGIDPALSDDVAAAVNELMARGVPSQQAVLAAITKGLSDHMHEQAGLSGLGGLGTTMPAADIARLITASTTAATRLANTAGNIAISAQQARTRQTVTGLPGLPAQAAPAAGLPAADPYAGAYGVQQPAPSAPPWGLIIGGGVVVLGLGAYWYTTQQKKPPAKAA